MIRMLIYSNIIIVDISTFHFSAYEGITFLEPFPTAKLWSHNICLLSTPLLSGMHYTLL